MSKNIFTTLTLFALALSLVPSGRALGQSSNSPIRIGTFDSRAVALAFWRSEQGNKILNDLRKEMDNARADKDEKRIKELEIEGPGLQFRMHQQVFSTGTVSDIIEKIRPQLPAIAQEAGAALIVSKWEVAFKTPPVEYFDLTPQLVKLFNPDEKVLKMIQDIVKSEPVPIAKLSMDWRD